MSYSIDFEFHSSNEPKPHLICAAVDGKGYDLEDVVHRTKFIRLLKEMRGERFLGYYTVAEARCFHALGLNPLDYKWEDGYAEFKNIQNSCNRFKFGPYIDKHGEVNFLKPKEADEEADEFVPGEEPKQVKVPSNLVNFVYKTLGIIIDSDEKKEVRDIILSKDVSLIKFHKERIIDYCVSDTVHLKPAFAKVRKFYRDQGLVDFEKDILMRGRYTAATAICEANGLPIDMELLNKIIDKTPLIITSARDEVNTLTGPRGVKIFQPEFTREPTIQKNGKTKTYVTKPARKSDEDYQNLIKSLNLDKFPVTDTKKFSSKKDVLGAYRYISELNALYNCNTMETNLKWFKPGNGDGFFEALGSDERVRPFFGVFGTQTGRNAAKATTFPFAMSSWLRAIIKPKPDTVIIGADFSQQEIYVAASISGDKALRAAYNSGDVYLAFAKQAGLVPEDATKASHKMERNMCKATVLGLQFGMGVSKLALKLSFELQRLVTDVEAKVMVDHHRKVFATFWQYVWTSSKLYEQGIPFLTPDGFVLFEDNPSMTSVRNFPVQGTAASITRLAIVKGLEAGLKVLSGLHDAVYIESTKENAEKDAKLLEEIMIKCAAEILSEPLEKCTIRVDVKTITPEETWVEEKGERDWKRVSELLYK